MNPIEQIAEDTLEDDVNNEAVKKEQALNEEMQSPSNTGP